ncbi:MAG: hypothetical protein ACLPJH_16965 [Myxococcaceae bacterium]
MNDTALKTESRLPRRATLVISDPELHEKLMRAAEADLKRRGRYNFSRTLIRLIESGLRASPS